MRTEEIDAEIDRVWNNLASHPAGYSSTLTRRQLKAFLLRTDGRIFARGYQWDIVSKHIGAGVYRVSVERSK